jgi:hypothetical protein
MQTQFASADGILMGLMCCMDAPCLGLSDGMCICIYVQGVRSTHHRLLEKHSVGWLKFLITMEITH